MRVEGLETLDYLDNLKNKERFTEQGDAITFETEVGILMLLWNFSCALFIIFYFLFPYFNHEGGQDISQYTNKNCYTGP